MTIKSFRQFYAPDLVASNPAVSTIQVDIDTYDTIAELPLSGNTEGKQAFVLSNKGLYIWNGTGWYNIALLSSDLTLSQGSNASYTLAKDGTASNVSLSASSTNAITWTHEIVGGSLTNGGGTTATIGQVGNVFTITPTTVEDYMGTFTVKFVGTDGTAYVGSESEFILAWLYWFGGRGLFGGGATLTSLIDYVTIATTGDAIYFGDLTVARDTLSSCSNATYGLFAGGNVPSNVIDYVTISSLGNAIDFGDLTVARSNFPAACSDGTYGLFGGGNTTARTNIIDYVTIATPGNAIDFGDLTVARYSLAACSNGTYGLFGGGYSTAFLNVIDYVTIATPGNATNFGTLTVARNNIGSCSNKTYGLFGSGWTGAYSNVIDYVTIATPGNAIDFGDLTVGRYAPGACSDGTYGLFGGGTSPTTNIIDYVTIDSPGNATNFGVLTVARKELAACSGN